ncbi:MAG: dihydrolipoyl dehydrogenase [Candidatus Zhuqueibacterota bacterium]
MGVAKFDLAVIGSGPGGYVAAVRAAQLGKNVAVVERDELGGVCLNWGCIPTKALLKSAEVYSNLLKAKEFGLSAENIAVDFPGIIKRSRQIADRMAKGVQFLFKKNNVTLFQGSGRLSDAGAVAVFNSSGEKIGEISARDIVIATGARPRSIPGVAIDRKKIITSREAMSLEKIPESMIVIGAGAIGVEFAHFYHTFGCKVTLVEMLPTVLPIEDNEITDVLNRAFRRAKIAVHTGSLVKKVTVTENSVKIGIEKDGSATELEAELALMAIGVQGNYENLGLEELGVAIEKSFIKVDEQYQTSVNHIYAIGDIIGPPLLAHVASAEAVNLAERLAGILVAPINYSAIPGCTYCNPQIASIGLTEEKARQKGYELKIGRFPFIANGKSLALGERDGMVKLIFDAKSDVLLGAHLVHAEATELIGELALAMSNNLKAHDVIKTVHAHPTLSEAVMEAAASAYGEAVHG